MKPFLFLGTRPEDDAADNEYASVVRCTGLPEGDVRRRRLERDPLGDVNLEDWSGIILGGGPFNKSDPEAGKSPEQRRAEDELHALAERVVAADFPFFGACYGIGILGSLRDGLVDRTHGEPIGATSVSLTDEGREDPLFDGLPDTFDVFLGHKEAVSRLPEGAVRLAFSATCPSGSRSRRRRSTSPSGRPVQRTTEAYSLSAASSSGRVPRKRNGLMLCSPSRLTPGPLRRSRPGRPRP